MRNEPAWGTFVSTSYVILMGQTRKSSNEKKHTCSRLEEGEKELRLSRDKSAYQMGLEHSSFSFEADKSPLEVELGLYLHPLMVLSNFQRSVIRIVPVSFVLGAFIEFFMINVRVGSETFCKMPMNISHFI
jgi:hypothetical protein